MLRASVIIPAYNAAAFIERAVASALRQTLQDIEILVVDDGSTDETAEIVARLAHQAERLHLIRLPQNRGVSAARNAALEVARGEWVATLDADDWYDEGRLARLLAASESADIVVDNRYQLYEDSDRQELFLPDGGPARSFVFSADFVRNSGAGAPHPLNALCPIFRRTLIEGAQLRFEERLVAGEDTLFLFQALDLTTGAVYVSQPGYFRLVRRDSLSYGSSLATRERDLAILRRAFDRQWKSADMRQAVERFLAGMERSQRITRIGRPLKRGRILAGLAAALRDPAGAWLMLLRLAFGR